MKQTLTFVLDWAPYTPEQTIASFAEAIRRAVTSETDPRAGPPFDHFRRLVEFTDTRHHPQK